MMTVKELSDLLSQYQDYPDAKVVIAKKKKRGGYTLYPQVKETKATNIPLIGGPCVAIIYTD